ncbi:hypothetical protein U5801_04530 [Lamprobacter modestohalophilus]|uniref:hypothetical protein n=1 Tax=Lamprobacter modestohalophilus TaxID=1064514 RepID=UPI002ADEDB18|nr:hypothetical protein [Lamprobacter modestohalophilus]MEA1049077.1 hypothetical protein [Lamprobacter modestohalophilus]
MPFHQASSADQQHSLRHRSANRLALPLPAPLQVPRWWLRLFLLLLQLGLFAPHGDVFADEQSRIPAALAPWVDWVLDDEDHRACSLGAVGAAERICAWPGQLRLELNDNGGHFEQIWTLAAESWLPLPGGRGQWPQQVSANALPVPVVERNAQPMLRLAAGEIAIRGRFAWPRRPDVLQVPAEIGLLSLRLNGVEIEQPRLDAGGRLWLGSERGPRPRQEPDALSLEVMRRIKDSVPLRVQTRLLLEVSGQPRELLLGPVLLPGGIPLSIESLLPARLIEPWPAPNAPSEQGGQQLQLQLRPGRWELMLESYHPGPVGALSLPQRPVASASEWPEQEVWVFAAEPALRQVELSGADPIDPRQTRLPPAWQQLPAYLLRTGQTLKLEQLSRGNAGVDQVQLERSLRLDFDGAGLSLRDRLSGDLRERWRVQAEPPLELGQVSVDGEPRLITRLASEDERQGVEVRGGWLELTADARIDSGPVGWRLDVPGSGWALPLSGATTQLDLPPGWDLLAVAGVDNLPDSWLARWTLLDIFLVLIAALAVARVWGWRWGLLALLTLVLTWQEPGAPRWAWLNLIAAAVLMRLLPSRSGSESGFASTLGAQAGALNAQSTAAPRGPSWLGCLVRFYYRLALLILALIAIPFLVSEMRDGLFPQLERQGSGLVGLGAFGDGVAEPVADLDSSLRPQAMPAPAAAEAGLGKRRASLSEQPARDSIPKPLPMLDPNAQLQTGAGVPDWTWRRFELRWSGPMPPEHRLQLWLLPASAALVLAFITLLLVPLLGLRLADRLLAPLKAHKSAVLSLIGVGLIAGAWLAPGPALAVAGSTAELESVPGLPLAEATFPPAALLEQLRQRLLEPPDCLPRCAEIAHLVLDATASELRLLLAVDAAEAVAVPVPGARTGWTPTLVQLDAEGLDRLLRLPNGDLAAPVPRGRHLLLLSGPLASSEQIEIPLPLPPRLVEANLGDRWQLEGVGSDGVPGDQLRLRRQGGLPGPQSSELDPASPSSGDVDAEAALPPLLKITRTLRFGLDWGLTTAVERLSPLGQPVTVRVGLIPGESVTTAGVQVSEAGVLVSLPPERGRMRWSSVLRPVDRLAISASTDPRLTEEWRLQVSPIWHLNAEGVPVVQPAPNEVSALPTYRPWPGEVLRLSLSRPLAVPGPTLTLDRSHYQVQPGPHSSEVRLQLSLRSSQGGRHSLLLPDGAEPTRLSIDGQLWPLIMQGQSVDLSLTPGTQEIALEWRAPGGLSFVYRPSSVGLGVAGVNAKVQVRLGDDRWLLWTSGPGIGPAVQFWGLLLVIAIIAFLLARSGLTPLGFADWLLLGVGLSQVSVWVGAVVVLWLFALGARRRMSTEIAPWRFNLTQVALVALTIAALGALLVAVQQGLLGSPSMQVAGNGSSATNLNWYLDRNGAQTAPVSLISAPIWIYRLLMLAWALWLAWRLLDWLRWGWQGLVEPTPWLQSRRQSLKRKVSEQNLSIDL